MVKASNLEYIILICKGKVNESIYWMKEAFSNGHVWNSLAWSRGPFLPLQLEARQSLIVVACEWIELATTGRWSPNLVVDLSLALFIQERVKGAKSKSKTSGSIDSLVFRNWAVEADGNSWFDAKQSITVAFVGWFEGFAWEQKLFSEWVISIHVGLGHEGNDH